MQLGKTVETQGKLVTVTRGCNFEALAVRLDPLYFNAAIGFRLPGKLFVHWSMLAPCCLNRPVNFACAFSLIGTHWLGSVKRMNI